MLQRYFLRGEFADGTVPSVVGADETLHTHLQTEGHRFQTAADPVPTEEVKACPGAPVETSRGLDSAVLPSEQAQHQPEGLLKQMYAPAPHAS